MHLFYCIDLISIAHPWDLYKYLAMIKTWLYLGLQITFFVCLMCNSNVSLVTDSLGHTHDTCPSAPALQWASIYVSFLNTILHWNKNPIEEITKCQLAGSVQTATYKQQ